MTYFSKDLSKYLRTNEMVLCRCPNWCELGYQVAQWDGVSFDYPDASNNDFDSTVIAFLPLDKEGYVDERRHYEIRNSRF